MGKNTVVRQAAALVAGLMITLAVPAYADTIGISGGTLIVGAEPGDGNQVFAPTIDGADLVLPDLNAAIVTPGCTNLGTSIICPLAGFQDVVILGGDGDDVINLSGISGLTFSITALGGAGDDVLIGTPGNVKLFGGAGNDVLTVMPGNCFSRGSGTDVVLGAGCDAGLEPAFAPLPREVVPTPEPDGLVLLGSGLVGLAAMTSRKKFKRLLRPRALETQVDGGSVDCISTLRGRFHTVCPFPLLGGSDEGIAPLNAGFFRAHGIHRHTHAMRSTYLARRQY